MENYAELQGDIVAHGEERSTRTGERSVADFFNTLSYDLRESFPLVDTRALNPDPIIGELCGFIQGSTSAADFRQFKSKIWDANANGTGRPDAPNAWLSNPHRKGTDDLGRIYGAQWRFWESVKLVNTGSPGWRDVRDAYLADGYTERGRFPEDDPFETIVLHKNIDQLQNLIDGIKADPQGRRHIVSAWNPGELKEMALPPCHVMFQCYVSNDGHLDMIMFQRSADVFLGVPFNIASYAALNHVIANFTGYKPRYLHVVMGDTHIYENALIGTLEQLKRERTVHRPKLIFNGGERWNRTDDVRDWKKVPVPKATTLNEITPDHFVIDGYYPHPAIKVKMAV